MATDSARSAFVVDGRGVKVGVLSNSFNSLNGYDADSASGDLPPNVRIIKEGNMK